MVDPHSSPVLDPREIIDSPKPEKPKLTTEKEKLLFTKIDLSGAKVWDPELLEEAK